MRDSVEIFVPDGGKASEENASVGRCGFLAAINGYAVPSRGESCRKLFRECFKTAVPGRNAASAEDGELHTNTIARKDAKLAKEHNEDLGELRAFA